MADRHLLYISVRDLHRPHTRIRCHHCNLGRQEIMELRDRGRGMQRWWARIYTCCGRPESAQAIIQGCGERGPGSR